MSNDVLKHRAAALVHDTLDRMTPGEWIDALGVIAVTSTGIAFYCEDPTSLRAGFGVYRSLTPSVELYAAIGSWNQWSSYTFASLVPERDGDGWSLIIGFKYVYSWFDDESLSQHLVGVLTNHPSALEAALERFRDYGGRHYFDPGSSLPELASRLMQHLLG